MQEFLWHGTDDSKRGGLVAWSVVCEQKAVDGLGVKPITRPN